MDNNTKTNIALIGMMGTFKTSAGKILAKITGKSFTDTDNLIVALSGKSIPELFEEGESSFRVIEHGAVKLAAEGDNTVIACGGGVALFDNNVEELKKSCVVVLLTASEKAIFVRIGKSKTRPLIADNPREKIKSILQSRSGRYEQVADIVIDNSKLSARQTAHEIIKKTVNFHL